MRIGELARRTGVSVRALRYYEEHGLLVAERTAGHQRVYAAAAPERVRLLRRLFAAGLSSTTIGSLLPCVDRPFGAVTSEAMAVMRREHERIGGQIAELGAAREQLAYLIDAAERFHDDQVTGAPVAGAPVG